MAMRVLGVVLDFVGVSQVSLVAALIVRWRLTIGVELPAGWQPRVEVWVHVLVSFFLYTTVFELWRGQTITKIAFQAKVVTSDGRKPAPGRVILRNAIKAIELTFFPIAFAWLFRTRTSFAESLSGTRVISATKKRTGSV